MSGASHGSWATIPADEERYRPLYARILGLRFVNPGGVLCFLFFEGVVALAALLALAELVTWWAVLVLPAAVAVMVKLNDMVAALVVRSAAAVPEQERERFRRQMEPVVGRAQVEWITHSVPGVVITSEPLHTTPAEPARNGSESPDRSTGVAPVTGAGGADPPDGPGSARRASNPPETGPGSSTGRPTPLT
ncbi:hypothetical protein [Micromonospora echinaurantiaca]|uniref:hypothetical protein n=1 Tax=Micromonospora echinaurantiaca TaxID=47857 RepID=UPI003431CC46